MYVVWKTIDQKVDEVLYIGMTGRFTGEGAINPNAWLSKRQMRWHPYCFTKEGPYENHFEFGPKFSVDKIKLQEPQDRYESREHYSNLRIDCFVFSFASKAAPAALESMFLQMYLEQFQRLPVANNSF